MGVDANVKENLRAKLEGLPEKSGVYIMYDRDGTIIYIGKAVVLKNRVRQYFHNSKKLPKVEAMVEKIATFDYIITVTELDALILEANLIKKHRPQYNILLKDDKAAPYIRIDLKKEFAPIEVTRRIRQDGARYFGPYVSGISVNDVAEIVKSAYKLRSCTAFKKGSRACLNYHIGLCSGACEGHITAEEYRAGLDRVCAFLAGRDDEAAGLIKLRMEEAAEAEEFERAIRYRDQLNVLEKLKRRAVVSLTTADDFDMFAYAGEASFSMISVLYVRGGKMMGMRNFPVTDIYGNGGEAMTDFILQYYSGAEMPSEVYMTELPENPEVLSEYLHSKAGRRIALKVAKKGQKARLAEIALENAGDALTKSVDKLKQKERMTAGAVDSLQAILGLRRRPQRIECYDISHISGTDKVASMTVLTNGEADKKAYRRFKIRTVEGNDDFACMKEVLLRRFAHAGDGRFGIMPDLIVVDGGKGQLKYALEAAAGAGLDTEIIALAEREEEIFVPDRSEPFVLSKSDNALKMLIRLRDEAHRFAVAYHHNLRGKRFESELLDIEGMGAKRVKALLAHFKDINAIKAAEAGDLAKVKGLDRKTAERIYNYFHTAN